MPFIMILAQLTALRKMIYSFIVASLAYSWRSILSITQMIMISYLIQSTTTMLLPLLACFSPATW